ncbi:OmcA/MtrC family decaheme c-type cytochrome [Shewanella sp. 10N.261.52.F9]|uniref:OmcA/MtrC family decaheme c-type cytochrome n=1 Tax=Shewanella TaxID=22 RepID=UPI00200D7F43|nr:OmcA/MtrC family decaheme c-type cytochrome [Shewanella marinintestina]MCL1147948.1 OmcA/MtrC family decaheme c-type cytochrome [Shewanella marinintestina]
MMNKFNLSAASKALLTAGLLSLAMTGCSGDDGKNGEDGKPGPVGKPIGEVSQVEAEVTSASVSEDGFLTVNFNLADANGAAVFGLQQNDIGAVSFGRMGKVKDIDDTNVEGADREIWLSYFNKDKGEGHYTGSSYFQGKNCENCLTDNGDGSYTLVLDKAVDTLEKYAYDAEVTNGIYLGVKSANDAGSTLVNNTFFYWQPSSDTAQDKPKAVIADETCQSCHRPGQDGALSMHGGKHVTLESCTFCHADYNSYMKQDKDTDGNAVGAPYEYDGSIKGMAHEIHSHSYYNGIYPQSASNCLTCHQPDENLAMADAWKGDVDTATCMNCHNSPYAVPSWHWDSENNQIAESKENCVSCHNDPDGYRGAERGHYSENNNAQSTELKVVFNSMTYANDTITANFSVKDGEELVPFDQIDKRPYKYGGYNSAIVVNGVLTDDFLVNYQKVGWNKLTANADGTITATITATDFNIEPIIDAGATIALSSQLHVCFGEKGVREACTYVPGENSDGTPTKGDGSDAGDQLDGQEAPYLVSDTFFFKQDGTAVTETPRSQHAEMSDCQQCHTTSITHRYTNDIDGCASCHNGTRDKKGAGSSNLAYIVHSKHYLYDSSGDMFFKKAECQACHGEDGFSLSHINGDAAPVAFGTTDGGRYTPGVNEQLVVSPQTAACVSCHQAPYALDESAASHIKSMGGILVQEGASLSTLGIPASEYEKLDVQETCSTCHKDASLLEAHANWGSSH